MACLKASRSSPLRMASGFAPIISTPYFLQDAGLVQLHREVEGGLAAERGQQRRGPLRLDDLLQKFQRERLDVGHVGKLRVGHDRGRVGVHQHHPVTLLLQRLAGLGAGIVELAGLADDDGPGADDEDGVKVGAFGHGRERPRGLRAGVRQRKRERKSVASPPAPGGPKGPFLRRLGGRAGGPNSAQFARVHPQHLRGPGLVVLAGVEHHVEVLLLLAGEILRERRPVLAARAAASGSCWDVTTRVSVVETILDTTCSSSARLPGQW